MMDGVAVACSPPSNRVMLRPPPLHNVSNNARSFRTSSLTADLKLRIAEKMVGPKYGTTNASNYFLWYIYYSAYG